MRISKEHYLAWARAAIAQHEQFEPSLEARLAAFAEHDPYLAELERQGLECSKRTVEYLRARLEGKAHA